MPSVGETAQMRRFYILKKGKRLRKVTQSFNRRVNFKITAAIQNANLAQNIERAITLRFSGFQQNPSFQQKKGASLSHNRY